MNFKLNEVFIEKGFQIIIYAICLGLCLYQIFTISELYFAYKTQTSVKYDNTSTISLPGITLCFNKWDLLKKNDLAQFKSSHDYSASISNISIKDQLALMYDFDDIFENCSVSKTRGLVQNYQVNFSYIKCEHISGIKRSINYDK